MTYPTLQIPPFSLDTPNNSSGGMDLYQQYIHISHYARWREDLQRRETWDETVQRYIDFFDKRFDGKFSDYLNTVAKPMILNLHVMPSMRALATAGLALERDNLAGFNCLYLALNSKRKFSEALYALMNGVGVGFSCERQEINKLPAIPEKLEKSADVIVVGDSKEGWARALQKLLNCLWLGEIPTVDFSHIRPAGSRLKTFGGRASGPEPLKRLFDFCVRLFIDTAGAKLTSLQVHDIMCMIGEIVVVGGVRRSALISLSNLSDDRMRDAKSGQWWIASPFRALANNSVAYTEKPEIERFMEEWLALMKSKSGERGIVNRVALKKQASRWGRRSADIAYGVNPCSEVILRDCGLCNLAEAVIRADDDLETLIKKVEVATVLGTMQASLTSFQFVSELWKQNAEEEALLGVSLTGIMDNAMMSGRQDKGTLVSWLERLREHARAVNAKWAPEIGVNVSAAITCVKPSGSVSQLVNSASGIHQRHNSNYIRTVRIDKKDPLYKFMKDKGFVIEDEILRPEATAVVSFPMTAPASSVMRTDMPALEFLELWLLYHKHYCEHKPSVTINVKDHEWLEVGAWVYKHFDEVAGISFLPHDGGTYRQAPYQDMTTQELQEWMVAHPQPLVDWRELARFEAEDNTVSAQTLACVAGACEFR